MPCGTTDLLGPPAFLYDLLLVPGTGGFSVPTATDQLGIVTGDLVPADHLVAPPCSPLAPALGTWPAAAACLVTLHLLAAIRLHCMVLHATGAVHLVPPAWVSHCLAHAGGLQWPTLLGTATTIANLHRVPAHPGQPPTPYGSHSKAAGSLCGLPTGYLLLPSWAPLPLRCPAGPTMLPGSGMLYWLQNSLWTTPCILPLSTGNSLCSTEVQPPPLLTSMLRLTHYCRLD